MKRIAYTAIAAAVVLAPAAIAQTDAAPVAVEVSASRIDRFDAGTPVGARYGELTFLGGLQLQSVDPDFGGLSGLRLGADGRSFTAISDRGNWFRGEIAYDESRPVGLKGVTRAPTPGRDGRPLPGRRGFDTEGLEIDGRTAWVSSERTHWLTRYALDAEGRPVGAGKAIALPREAASAPNGFGYEAIARLASGAIVLVAENFRDKTGNNRGFVVGGKSPIFFAVRRDDEFLPTDLVALPDGDLVLLERRYRPIFSLAVRMRRIKPADILPGAVVDGPVIMQAGLAQTIDNFEGLSAHRAADGRTVLTVVSDDNFSALQRTLMMQFAVER